MGTRSFKGLLFGTRGITRHEEQKQVGWEMTVSIEKTIYTILYEAHEQQCEATIDVSSPESRIGPMGNRLSVCRNPFL